MKKLFLFLLIGCGTNENALKRDLIKAIPYSYDLERDSEITEERAMKCAKEIIYEVPGFDIVEMDHEVVYIDCLEEGVIVPTPDFITLINNNNSNLALIITND